MDGQGTSHKVDSNSIYKSIKLEHVRKAAPTPTYILNRKIRRRRRNKKKKPKVNNYPACTRFRCRVCSTLNYTKLSDDIILKLDNPKYFNSTTEDELLRFKFRYCLEREHDLHKGPKPKWLTKIRLCSSAQEAILRSYTRPPAIVIKKYNDYASANGLPLCPENHSFAPEIRRFKISKKKQREELGLDVPRER
ncbi:hypothetical protein PUN28_011567 [Cardiocondyla obscurior]|uniref:Uncharacterized protein n=1 Tax=Cardiocondyla obscurior TaxID=286306 RepID=A0AAW2FH40_9HYME